MNKDDYVFIKEKAVKALVKHISKLEQKGVTPVALFYFEGTAAAAVYQLVDDKPP